jgi:drug/metabolite transporter (DMT)-like permease
LVFFFGHQSKVQLALGILKKIIYHFEFDFRFFLNRVIFVIKLINKFKCRKSIIKNHLQTPTAVESSIINSTMLPQIAILAWVFLGEGLNLRQMLGLGLVTIGIVIVQVWRGKRQ